MDEDAERHLALMRAVLDKIGREHLLLKGGTALMFGYNVPRFSDDLDFDAKIKIRNIEKKLKEVSAFGITVVGIDTLKNTDTTTRYRVRYQTDGSAEVKRLKVEISYRQSFDEENDVMTVDGIRFASLPRIIDQKLQAAYDGKEPRTKARDLFDLDFISTKYPDTFRPDLADRLAAFAADPIELYERYAVSFETAGLDVSNEQIEEMVLRLHENAKAIQKAVNLPVAQPGKGETSVALLSKFAELDYVPSETPSSVIRIVHEGGHSPALPVGTTSNMPLTVDLSLVPKMNDKHQRTVEVLKILAVDLNCREAARVLEPLGIIQPQADGTYLRTNRKPPGNAGGR